MRKRIQLIKVYMKFRKLSYYEKYLLNELLDKNIEYNAKIKILQETLNESTDFTAFTMNRLLFNQYTSYRKQTLRRIYKLIPELEY